MVTRIPFLHLFRHVIRFGTSAALAVILVSAGFPGHPALAANPYRYTDRSEGDPGDGVLDPQAREDRDTAADEMDEGSVPCDQGFFLIPVVTYGNGSCVPTLRFLLMRRSGPACGEPAGALGRLFPFDARGFRHAR